MRIQRHICVWWKQVHTQQNWEKIFVKWGGSQRDTLQWPFISKCDIGVKNTNLKAITWVSYYSSISVTDCWLISKLMEKLIFEFLSNFIWISISFRYYKGCVWGIIFIFILISHASIEFFNQWLWTFLDESKLLIFTRFASVILFCLNYVLVCSFDKQLWIEVEATIKNQQVVV